MHQGTKVIINKAGPWGLTVLPERKRTHNACASTSSASEKLGKGVLSYFPSVLEMTANASSRPKKFYIFHRGKEGLTLLRVTSTNVLRHGM